MCTALMSLRVRLDAHRRVCGGDGTSAHSLAGLKPLTRQNLCRGEWELPGKLGRICGLYLTQRSQDEAFASGHADSVALVWGGDYVPSQRISRSPCIAAMAGRR